MSNSFLLKHMAMLLGMYAGLLLFVSPVLAEKGLAGWEVGSEYNKLYNYKERDTLRGNVGKFVSVKPLKGMAPGTAFWLDEGGGDEILVHVGPESFATARDIGLRPGEFIKVKGAWAEIGDESVFIAAKIRREKGSAYKVRLTKDGTPFWTMDQEQLARELASTE
jgi:hypothetical protein